MRKQFAATAIGLLCTIMLTEVILRLLSRYSLNIKFFTQNPYQQSYFTEAKNWKGIADQYPGKLINGFVFNSHGFESPEYGYEKPAGTKRILFLGDSQTVGAVPYAESFVRLIDTKLQTEKQNVQVLNLGVVCVGPGIEAQVLKYEGIKYQPDIIVLGFFVGNDFTDDQNILDTYNQNKKQTHLFPFWLYQSKIFSLIRNYHLYLNVGNNWSPFTKNTDTHTGTVTNTETLQYESPLTEQEYLQLKNYPTYMFFYGSDTYKNWGSTQKYILEMKQLAEQTGAKFLVVIIPDELQINQPLLQKVTAYHQLPLDRVDILLPQRTIKNFLEPYHIPYIDLLQEWQASAAAQSYYIPRDIHLNSEGNQTVADILYPKIKELLH